MMWLLSSLLSNHHKTGDDISFNPGHSGPTCSISTKHTAGYKWPNDFSTTSFILIS